jgi:broad specificity phosphatase PhoE
LALQRYGKTVLCIRHGESTFNAAWRAMAVDPLHFDAPLSETGFEQVAHARTRIRDLPIELVVVSPLTRALQTASRLFADHPARPPIIVHPLARERVENSCDVGRAPAAIASDFPHIDVGDLPSVWWHAQGVADERGICVEPIASVERRVADFRSFLEARPERHIAVVGHGTFFFHLTGRMLANCEMTELTLA